MFKVTDFLIVLATLLFIVVACTLTMPKCTGKGRKTHLSHTFRIFCCYNDEDYPFLEKLEKHLSSWKSSCIFETWDKRRIPAGVDNTSEIKLQLKNSNIVILIVSVDFLASDDCINQTKFALEFREKARIVVVPVRYVNWHNSEIIGQLESLLTNEPPIKAWEDPDQAYLVVTQKIYELACTLPEYRQKSKTDEV